MERSLVVYLAATTRVSLSDLHLHFFFFCSWPHTVTPGQDVKKCLDALDEIGALQVTTQHLQKHSELIATLKKVKPAKHD